MEKRVNEYFLKSLVPGLNRRPFLGVPRGVGGCCRCCCCCSPCCLIDASTGPDSELEIEGSDGNLTKGEPGFNGL